MISSGENGVRVRKFWCIAKVDAEDAVDNDEDEKDGDDEDEKDVDDVL